MAYDEYLADRVSLSIKNHRAVFRSFKMMGGLCFMVDEKMLCGVLNNKEDGSNLLMARIGEEIYEKELEKDVCLAMDFTGRPMKGYIFIKAQGFDMDDDLDYWIKLCLDFNPHAKASKKKKKNLNK